MSDEKPPEKPTKQLPAVPDWAIELTKSVRLGFGDVQKRLDEQDVKLDKQDSKLDKVVTEGIESNTRLTRIEVRVDDVERHVGDLESRIGRASSRVREQSQSDLEQNAQLAQERAAREALAKEVADVKTLTAGAISVLAQQSDFMGIGKRGAEWVASKEGRATLTQVAVVIGVVYGILKSSGVVK